MPPAPRPLGEGLVPDQVSRWTVFITRAERLLGVSRELKIAVPLTQQSGFKSGGRTRGRPGSPQVFGVAAVEPEHRLCGMPPPSFKMKSNQGGSLRRGRR